MASREQLECVAPYLKIGQCYSVGSRVALTWGRRLELHDEDQILKICEYFTGFTGRETLSAHKVAIDLQSLGLKVDELTDDQGQGRSLVIERTYVVPTYTDEEEVGMMINEAKPGAWVQTSPDLLIGSLDLARALFAVSFPGTHDPTQPFRGRGSQMDAIRRTVELMVINRRWKASLRTHTPGPWTVEGDFIAGKKGDRIATVLPAFALGRDDQPGNARLIAGSPDMLRIVKDIASWKLTSEALVQAAQAILIQLDLERLGHTYSDGCWRTSGTSVVTDFGKSGALVVVEIEPHLSFERDDQPGNSRLIAAAPVMYGIVKGIEGGDVSQRCRQEAQCLLSHIDLEN